MANLNVLLSEDINTLTSLNPPTVSYMIQYSRLKKAADKVQRKSNVTQRKCCFFFPSLQMRRCTSAPRYTTTTCTFYLYITPEDEFVFDKLESGDASDSDWTSWFQLLPYNKECVCVCLPCCKTQQHRASAAGGHTPLCAITRTPNWHSDQRKTKRRFFGYCTSQG